MVNSTSVYNFVCIGCQLYLGIFLMLVKTERCAELLHFNFLFKLCSFSKLEILSTAL